MRRIHGDGAMRSVSEDDLGVEGDLKLGRLRCPSCAGALRGWGWARLRTIRTVEGSWQVRPRRTRCAVCRQTHVLLPSWMLLRRADAVEVIGAALVANSRAVGYRRIARAIARPPTTVRDWLRRWAKRSQEAAAQLGGRASSPRAAVHVVYAAAAAAGAASAWAHAARRTEGRLLCNTSPPRPHPRVPAPLPSSGEKAEA